MQIDIQNDELVKKMGLLLRAEVESNEDGFAISMAGKKYNLANLYLDELRGRLVSMKVLDELTLASARTIEVAVKEESRFPMGRMRRDEGLEIEDNENGCHYSLGSPSDEYVLFLFSLLPDLENARHRPMVPFPSSMMKQMVGECGDDIFVLIGRVLVRVWSIRISSSNERSTESLKSLIDSMLFQLTYNLDASLVVQRHVEEVFRFRRITRNRRSGIEEIDPPRRKYISDLVHHYQLGVASDSHILEYLSYYHVAEHFFETVFNDDLVESIKHQITDPGFSYKRKSDVRKIIKIIGKSLSYKNETVSFNEQSALQLTITSHVDLDSLKSRIDNYDETLLDYYRTDKVSFSDGGTVDFDLDKQAVVKSLAGRIYKNRCSLVHSKESDKSKFAPFRDDKQLLKEVPLMRFVAEEIIINSSEMMS
jgi:hypothetical protein